MRFTWYSVEGGAVQARAEFEAERIPEHTLEEIADIYATGGLMALATDTVYGLTALVGGAGIAKVFAAKGRPREAALPVFAPSAEGALSLCDPHDQRAVARLRALGEKFWPGALTAVIRRSPPFAADLGGEDPTSVGIRVPRGAVLVQLLERVGPFVATSANLHGRSPILEGREFLLPGNAALLKHLDGLLTDALPPIGTPSTVVDLRHEEVRILRVGAIPEAAIRAVVG
ncbi:MAG: L-threonylcarbamoyladenylate synthase [Actinomycetota bacterium]|nr:L-threonylcarbamoyladenylate synthase [Actinomycetota bacterium]